jgi:acid phosphatase type 7
MKMIGERFRAATLLGAAVSVLVFAAGSQAQNQNNGFGWGNSPAHDNPWPYNTPQRSSPVLAVVGDISCQPGEEASGESSKETCTDPKAPYTSTALYASQEATANQIEAMKPDAVALLGDLQYQVGRYSDFENSYDLTYGAFKMISRPAPGNHEFYDEHGETGVAGYGYFSYFNGFLIDTTADATQGKPLMTTIPDPCPSNPACGPGSTPTTDLSPQPIPRANGQAGHFELGANGGQNGTGVGEGWYSYNLGSWHLISLNIECSTQPGGCSTAGPWFAAELAWLQKDLDENHAACTLAYWHQPTFSATNGITTEGIAAKAFWQLLYEHNADLVLNGHDHLYAHYRPLNPSGNFDPHRGITEFIVGTGGETLDPVVTTTVTSGSGETNMEDPSGNTNFNAQNLVAATGDYWGVMALTLHPNGYAWHYQSALQGPVNNGQWPSVAPTGTYTDNGVGACHGSVNR